MQIPEILHIWLKNDPAKYVFGGIVSVFEEQKRLAHGLQCRYPCFKRHNDWVASNRLFNIILTLFLHYPQLAKKQTCITFKACTTMTRSPATAIPPQPCDP